MMPKTGEIHIKGTPISRGIAIGCAFFFITEEGDVPAFKINLEQVESEVSGTVELLREDVRSLIACKSRCKKKGFLKALRLLNLSCK